MVCTVDGNCKVGIQYPCRLRWTLQGCDGMDEIGSSDVDLPWTGSERRTPIAQVNVHNEAAMGGGNLA